MMVQEFTECSHALLVLVLMFVLGFSSAMFLMRALREKL